MGLSHKLYIQTPRMSFSDSQSLNSRISQFIVSSSSLPLPHNISSVRVAVPHQRWEPSLLPYSHGGSRMQQDMSSGKKGFIYSPYGTTICSSTLEIEKMGRILVAATDPSVLSRITRAMKTTAIQRMKQQSCCCQWKCRERFFPSYSSGCCKQALANKKGFPLKTHLNQFTVNYFVKHLHHGSLLLLPFCLLECQTGFTVTIKVMGSN